MRALFWRLLRSRSVASGAALYIVMRWFDRLVGVVSTIILARLLTAEDFGIVALASIALGLAVVFLDLGINLAVVQRRDMDREDLDTAWTLRFLQNAVIAAALALSSSWIASYYRDARLEPVIFALAVAYLFDGLTGLGPVIFQKRQEYAREVGFFMAKRLFGFTVTIALAVWLRSYWALVLATVVANLAGVLLSHSMYRVLPRFTLVRWRTFIGASFWLTAKSIGNYATTQLDKLVVGRREGPAVLGAYSIADQVAAMPGSELIQPTSRALFPAMAAAQSDLLALRRIYLSALGIQATLALPASLGLAMVAEDLVLVALGDKWAPAAPIMSALALGYSANALATAGNYLLVSMGAFKAQALVQWGMAALLAMLILVVFPDSVAVEIAWFRVLLGWTGVAAIAILVRHELPGVVFMDMFSETFRPVLASLAMCGGVVAVSALSAPLPVWTRLMTEVATGVVVYTVVLVALWHMAGRPTGAERWMLDRLGSLLRRSHTG